MTRAPVRPRSRDLAVNTGRGRCRHGVTGSMVIPAAGPRSSSRRVPRHRFAFRVIRGFVLPAPKQLALVEQTSHLSDMAAIVRATPATPYSPTLTVQIYKLQDHIASNDRSLRPRGSRTPGAEPRISYSIPHNESRHEHEFPRPTEDRRSRLCRLCPDASPSGGTRRHQPAGLPQCRRRFRPPRHGQRADRFRPGPRRRFRRSAPRRLCVREDGQRGGRRERAQDHRRHAYQARGLSGERRTRRSRCQSGLRQYRALLRRFRQGRRPRPPARQDHPRIRGATRQGGGAASPTSSRTASPPASSRPRRSPARPASV